MLSREPRRRWLELRTALFFLAATVWLVGVVIDASLVRWAAILIAVGGLALGLVARRSAGRASRVDPDA